MKTFYKTGIFLIQTKANGENLCTLWVRVFCSKGWVNFDASPTMRIQKIPILGRIIKSRLITKFPDQVLYGDIIKGLPGIENNYCDGDYCSHILERLSLNDFRLALHNTYKILKNGGIFRCVLPDLEYAAKLYICDLESNGSDSNIFFKKAPR